MSKNTYMKKGSNNNSYISKHYHPPLEKLVKNFQFESYKSKNIIYKLRKNMYLSILMHKIYIKH